MSMVFRKTFLTKNLPLKRISPCLIHDYEHVLKVTPSYTLYIGTNFLDKYRFS